MKAQFIPQATVKISEAKKTHIIAIPNGTKHELFSFYSDSPVSFHECNMLKS